MSGPTSADGSPASATQPAALGVLGGRAAAEGATDAAPSVQRQTATRARSTDLGTGEAIEQARAHARQQALDAQQELAEARRADDPFAGFGSAMPASARAVTTPIRRRELRPTKPRESLRLGDFHVGQAVTWEVAVLASVAAYRVSMAWFIPVLACALIAVALTAVRYEGRWLYEWLGLALRYRIRRREHAMRPDDADSLLSTLTRGGRVETIEIDEQELALISHAEGFTLAMEAVRPLSDGKVADVVQIPSLDDLLPAYDADEPPVSVQVIVHTVPAPGLRGEDDAVAVSYRELAGAAIPAQRRTWVSLQAMHTADAFRPSDMKAALVNAYRRVQRKLDRSGLQVDTLRPGETAAELFALVHPADMPDSSAAGEVRETWRGWRSGDDLHVTFRIVNWPDLGSREGAELIQRVAGVPASSITVAVGVRRDRGINQIEAVVRLVVPDERAAGRAVDELERVALGCGADLQRLDGQHVIGLGASVPLGGFAV